MISKHYASAVKKLKEKAKEQKVNDKKKCFIYKFTLMDLKTRMYVCFGTSMISEKRAFDKLRKNFEKIKTLEKKILVTHMHAAGTRSELSGFPGSSGIRKAIDKFQPDLFISGHIHELEGMEEKIGKTKVVNVGRRGKIIEI